MLQCTVYNILKNINNIPKKLTKRRIQLRNKEKLNNNNRLRFKVTGTGSMYRAFA